MASPMPRAPPVTIATLPLSFIACSAFKRCRAGRSYNSAVGWAKAHAMHFHVSKVYRAPCPRVTDRSGPRKDTWARRTMGFAFVRTAVPAPLPTLRLSRSHAGERALVMGEIEILVGRRRRAAPGAEHLGAQLQRVLEAVEVELGVGCEAVLRERKGFRRDLVRELEPFGQDRHHRGFIGRIERPADALDVGLDVAGQHVAVGLAPRPQHPTAVRLVRSDHA